MPLIRAKVATNQSVTKVLTFSAHGDVQGVFYWLGTFYGYHAWVNPQTLQVLNVVTSSVWSGSITLLSDRVANALLYSSTTAGQWVAFDLGEGKTLKPSYYTLRHDGETGYYLRRWKLQGSNNATANTVAALAAATWIDLDERLNDTTINSPDAWGGWVVAPVPEVGYRWLRVLMTGVNSSNDNYLLLGEVEFYGTLTRQSLV